MTIYLNLGSNLGDRYLNLEVAIACLLAAFQDKQATVNRSAFIESPPWGYDSENNYVNVGVSIKLDTYIGPEDVLRTTREIEARLNRGLSHRTSDGVYRDRYIDIDIIAIDSMVYESNTLHIPHPLMHKRLFVLQPMNELDPSWRHPVIGKTARELCGEFMKN